MTECNLPRRAWLHHATALLGVGGLALLAGCGSSPRAVPSQTGDDRPRTAPDEPAAPHAQAVTVHALGLVGTPYRYGGNTPDSGFDCSGLIGHVYQTNSSLVPPRTTVKMQTWGKPVPLEQVRMGDLVVFLKGGIANHAGIYVGSGRFVHAPSTGGVVRLDSLKGKYWSTQPVIVRRP